MFPLKVFSDIEFAVAYGYTVSVVYSDPSIIANDGKGTRPAVLDKNVTLPVSISDSERLSISAPLSMTMRRKEMNQASILPQRKLYSLRHR